MSIVVRPNKLIVNAAAVIFAGTLLLLSCLSSRVSAQSSTQAAVDLAGAVVVAPSNLTSPENKAVSMFVEEVEKRTQIHLSQSQSFPASTTAAIVILPASSLKSFAGKSVPPTLSENTAGAAEGYRIRIENQGGAARVYVVGNDSRGVLFGVGNLLRELRMEKGKISLPANLNITTAPKFALRGHQLGYRPKTNSYDAWTLPMWEQYIRDLAVFGTNSIELIPPRSDDDADSPHFPLSQIDTMVGMSKIIDDYGLDCWIWYPAMDKDYSDPKTVESALTEWGEVFKKLPRVDAVMVPGGDPGHTEPKYLMALLEKEAAVLRKYHPKAQMWIAPQGLIKNGWKNFTEFSTAKNRPG